LSPAAAVLRDESRQTFYQADQITPAAADDRRVPPPIEGEAPL
jgi:hypothetical protein